jgi:hypothetical protein
MLANNHFTKSSNEFPKAFSESSDQVAEKIRTVGMSHVLSGGFNPGGFNRTNTKGSPVF